MKKSLSLFITILGLTTPLQAGLLKSIVSSLLIGTCYMTSHTVAETGTTLGPAANYAPPKVIDVIPPVHGKGDHPLVVTLPEDKYFKGEAPLVITADCIYSKYAKPYWAEMSYENGTYVWGGTPPNASLFNINGGNYLIRFTAKDRFGKSASQKVPVSIEPSGTAFIVSIWIISSVPFVIVPIMLVLTAIKNDRRKVEEHLIAGEYALAEEAAKQICCSKFSKKGEKCIPHLWIEGTQFERERAIKYLADGSSVAEVSKIVNSIEENLLFEWKYTLQRKRFIGKPLKGNISRYVGLKRYQEYKEYTDGSNQSSLLLGE
ncbi:MAG: hypothetical protein AAF335_00090 [Bacteroidota bacterium]